jgi:hypothetical protein
MHCSDDETYYTKIDYLQIKVCKESLISDGLELRA